MEEYRLWGTGLRAAKCELVASYADVNIVKAPYTSGLSSQTPRMLGLRPDGKVSGDTRGRFDATDECAVLKGLCI